MKKLIAHAAALMTLAAMATDYSWKGEKAYSLEAGDTLTFSENATITSASSFTGSGTVIVSGGTLTLNYKITETPFSGFTGAIRIDSGATVDENSSQGFNEDGTYATSVFGPSAKIIFNGGTLRGFKGQNNSQITGPVEVTADSTLQNDRANSGGGVNLRFRSTATFSGDKTLTITSGDRWVELASGVNFSSFTGGIVLNGSSTQAANFYGTDYGESASWTFDANRDFIIVPGANNTAKFGAITAQTNGRIKINDDNTTIEVGARTGTSSEINIPFTNKPFTLKKVGAGTTLRLGSEVEFVSGSSINVAAGTLEVTGLDFTSVSATFASDSTLKLDSKSKASVGTAFGKLAFESGAKLSFAASGWTDGGEYTLFTYNNATPIADLSGIIEITGLSANSTVSFSDDNGTVTATVSIPTLVWKGTEGASWESEGAWTSGGNDCTFTANDKVSFTDGQSVALASEVSVAGMTIADDATVTITGSNGAKITASSITNGGTLTIAGDVTLDAQISGNIFVAADSTLIFISGQSIENLKFAGSGTVKFNTSDTMDLTYANLYANGVFSDFAGTLELTGGATLRNTSGLNDNSKVFFPSGMTVRLNGGTITENAESVNVTVNADIEILGGETVAYNKIYTRGANYNIKGNIVGSGMATFESGKRGFHLSGNNGEFTGTLMLKAYRGGSNGYGAGFSGANSAGAKACWILSGTDHENRDGSIRTFYINGISSSETPICFGALNVSDESCYVQLQNDPCYMTIGSNDCNVDSSIEGRFVYKKVALVKQGSTTLTLGKGFDFVNGTSSSSLSKVEGSTIRVAGGTLAVNATNLVAAVAVESGAILAGTGTVSSVTFADGAKIAFDSFPENPEAGATVDGIVVASWSGSKPVIANAPASTKGSWKVRTKSVEAGTQFYAEFVKKGLVIIVN